MDFLKFLQLDFSIVPTAHSKESDLFVTPVENRGQGVDVFLRQQLTIKGDI